MLVEVVVSPLFVLVEVDVEPSVVPWHWLWLWLSEVVPVVESVLPDVVQVVTPLLVLHEVEVDVSSSSANAVPPNAIPVPVR
ncbi:MAG: hypothetical protein CYG59_22050 [Chloroflexi bacterium]|nr:MAG: hypothetical protein CYG59_22050 [Chloroflexota bacterium]